MSSPISQQQPLGVSPVRIRALVPLVSVIATMVIALARTLATTNYYYWDDTQTGAYGIWWQVGEMVLEGRWTLMSPAAWQAGNYIAEGQWGLLSPLMFLIGLGAHLVPNAMVYATIVKVALLGAMSLGVHLLARSYGASPAWAFVAATAVPLAGFTTYMDAPSWVTGLINSALLPFTWWGLRKTSKGGNPLAYLVPMYLLVTAGYFAGVVVLAVLLVVYFADSLIARRWDELKRVVYAGAITLGFTISIFLPAVLTSPVTERGSLAIYNTGNLNADVSDLLAASSPVGTTTINGFWGASPAAPLQYIAWFLPLFVLVLPVARRVVRETLPLLALLAVSLILIVGPSDIGPLRYFARMLPYAALAACVLFAVFATHGLAHLSRRRIIAATAIIALTNWAAWAQVPDNGKRIALILVIQLAALALVVVVQNRPNLGRLTARRDVVVAAVVAVVGFALLIPQAYLYRTSPLPDFQVPETVTELQRPLAGVEEGGATLVVGNAYAFRAEPEGYSEALVANLWYVDEAEVANLYTVLPFLEYRDDVCADWRGVTCPELYDRLFTIDDHTHKPLADLLAVDHILAIGDSFPDGYPEAAAGWHVADTGEFTRRYDRDKPLAATGGVAWADDGLDVDVLALDDTRIQLRINDVPADGGELVFSRLAWPGYLVDGAQLTEPVRGYLLTVEVPEDAAGTTVTVTFRPPGWIAEVLAFGGAVLGTLVWLVIRLVRRRLDLASGVDHEDAPIGAAAE